MGQLCNRRTRHPDLPALALGLPLPDRQISLRMLKYLAPMQVQPVRNEALEVTERNDFFVELGKLWIWLFTLVSIQPNQPDRYLQRKVLQ